MTRFLSFCALITLLTACGGAHIHYVEEPAVLYPTSYFSPEFAGRTFVATHVELGIQTDNIYSVELGSFEIFFDPILNHITGHKNCNQFGAEAFAAGDVMEVRFIESENHLCSLEAFPSEIKTYGSFYLETYSVGTQVFINLVSPSQDVVIYLESY